MSVQMTRLLTAIEELLEGTIGSVRTVTSGDFMNTVYSGQDDEAKAVQALVKKSFDVAPLTLERSPATLTERSSLVLIEARLRVSVAYRLDSEVVKSRRKAVRAEAADDAETIRQALSYPGNLTQTNAGEDTNLVSGMLLEDGPYQVTREDWDANLMETQRDYRGWLEVSQAVA